MKLTNKNTKDGLVNNFVTFDKPTTLELSINALKSNLEVGQNSPNPLIDKIIIPYSLSQDADVQLVIYDIQVKVIYQSSTSGKQGLNELEVFRSELPVLNQSMLIYEISSLGQRQSKKMWVD